MLYPENAGMAADVEGRKQYFYHTDYVEVAPGSNEKDLVIEQLQAEIGRLNAEVASLNERIKFYQIVGNEDGHKLAAALKELGERRNSLHE